MDVAARPTSVPATKRARPRISSSRCLVVSLTHKPKRQTSAFNVRSSPSRIADQGINEVRCSFFKLPAAVSSALHHSKSSREGYDDTSKSIGIDCRQLVWSGADGLANELLKSAEQTLHALAHCCARNSRIERGARCQTTPWRRAACHIRNDQVEEAFEPGRGVALGQRITGRLQELPGVLVEGAQKNRFLVTVSVVKTAALHAGRRGQVLH